MPLPLHPRVRSRPALSLPILRLERAALSAHLLDPTDYYYYYYYYYYSRRRNGRRC